MILVRPCGIELVFQKTLEIFVAAKKMGTLPFDMIKRTHLQVPRIADKGKFKERIEIFPREHFIGCNHFGMARQLAPDPVTCPMTETAADKLREKQGVSPTIAFKSGPNACSTCLGNMNE